MYLYRINESCKAQGSVREGLLGRMAKRLWHDSPVEPTVLKLLASKHEKPKLIKRPDSLSNRCSLSLNVFRGVCKKVADAQ